MKGVMIEEKCPWEFSGMALSTDFYSSCEAFNLTFNIQNFNFLLHKMEKIK